jgi:hypothetical protein
MEESLARSLAENTVRGYECNWPDFDALLVGLAGALRRSELAVLDLRDVRWTREEMIITTRSSKTDQEGEGTELGIPFGGRAKTCPVASLKAWL